jgi:hypothetical protein
MGRPEENIPSDYAGTLEVRGVPLDEGGYDPGGAYWGTPDNLFVVRTEDGDETYHRGTMASVRAKYPRASWTQADTVSESDLDDMTQGYIRCALWASSDERECPLDDTKYGEDKLTKQARKGLRADCVKFCEDNKALVLRTVNEGHMSWEDIGHNLWLTRNGHGTGFWDRNLPKDLGDALTKASKAARERYLLVSRGWIYHQ